MYAVYPLALSAGVPDRAALVFLDRADGLLGQADGLHGQADGLLGQADGLLGQADGLLGQAVACTVKQTACSVKRTACSVKRTACSVKRTACSVKRTACSVKRTIRSIKKMIFPVRKMIFFVAYGVFLVIRRGILICDAGECWRVNSFRSIKEHPVIQLCFRALKQAELRDFLREDRIHALRDLFRRFGYGFGGISFPVIAQPAAQMRGQPSQPAGLAEELSCDVMMKVITTIDRF